MRRRLAQPPPPASEYQHTQTHIHTYTYLSLPWLFAHSLVPFLISMIKSLLKRGNATATGCAGHVHWQSHPIGAFVGFSSLPWKTDTTRVGCIDLSTLQKKTYSVLYSLSNK